MLDTNNYFYLLLSSLFFQAGLRHKINDNLMIYPGYIPREGVEPILLHYGLPFKVGNWSFSKLDHHEDDIVYKCGKLFTEPPYPKEVNEPKIDYWSILSGSV